MATPATDRTVEPGTNWSLLAEPGALGIVYGWTADDFMVREIAALEP